MNGIGEYLKDKARLLGTIESRSLPGLSEEQIDEALVAPLDATIKPGEKVVFVVSDHTRKTAIDRVLPRIVDRLFAKGCAAADWSILIASGIHRHPSPDEIGRILGSRMRQLFEERITCHDPDDSKNLIEAGVTPLGFKVMVNRRILECDRLVLTGTVTYHYHAGFGGGRKAIVPGCSSRETIAYNHSLVLDPDDDKVRDGVGIGRIDGNMVAEEMLAGAKLCEPDLVINSVLSDDGKMVGLFAGALEEAHHEACGLAEQVGRCDLAEAADFVVASTDNAKNWVQSHKALFNATRAVRDGGWVILDAPCPEGLGDERFRYWMTRPTVKDIYDELRQSVEVLGQTALSTRLRGEHCVLVTDMPRADLDALGIRAAATLEEAVDLVVGELGNDTPSFYLMPHARYTVPFVNPTE
jgi:nickel-dependent lactate racemase